MSLRLKILGGLIFIMAIFTLATGIVYYKIGELQVHVNDIPHEVERVNQLNIIKHNVASQAAAMRGFLYYKQDKYVEEFRKLGEESNSIIQTMIDTARKDSNKKNFKDLLNYQEQYNTVILKKLVPLVQEGREEEANEVALNEGVPLTNSFNNAIASYTEARNNNLVEIVQHTNSEFISLKQLSLFATILALIIGLLLGFFLARSITLPIQKVARESVKIAEGDLTGKEIYIKTKDEVGQLATAFNKMLQNLRELVIQVQEKSQVVASSSIQLSASSQNVAAGAEETASTISQVASTVEQVTENTQHIALTSEQAAAYAQEGNEGINRIGLQMESIENTTANSGKVINELNGSAAKISQIVELITQIADQTNLLALNAAIEAARAGEHGRGFAVVAEEVRKLAEQSANAAKEIHHLITTIQQETGKAVQSMADSIARVKEGSTVVSEVGTTFTKIISAVKNLSEELQSVAAATEQMSSSIQNVAATTEEQTSTIEEVSSTSQNLARMAEELDSLSKRFKVV